MTDRFEGIPEQVALCRSEVERALDEVGAIAGAPTFRIEARDYLSARFPEPPEEKRVCVYSSIHNEKGGCPLGNKCVERPDPSAETATPEPKREYHWHHRYAERTAL